MALDSNIPLFALRSMQSNQIGPEGVMKGYQGTQDLIAKQRMSSIAQQGLPFQEQYKQQLQALSGADPVAAMKLQAGQEAMRQKQAYALQLANAKAKDPSNTERMKIVSTINALQRTKASLADNNLASSQEYKDTGLLIGSLKREAGSPDPSIQRAFSMYATSGGKINPVALATGQSKVTSTTDDNSVSTGENTFNVNSQTASDWFHLENGSPVKNEGEANDKWPDAPQNVKDAFNNAMKEYEDIKAAKQNDINRTRENKQYIDKKITSQINNIENTYQFKKQYNELYTARNKISNIITNYNNGNTAGAAYISLKQTLGDAINGPDFVGVVGNKGFEGLKASFKELLNNSPISEEQAKRQVSSTIESFNNILAEREQNYEKARQDKSLLINDNNGGVNDPIFKTALKRDYHPIGRVPSLGSKSIKSSRSNESSSKSSTNVIPPDKVESVLEGL